MIVAPIDIPITRIKVPNHFPKIKPASNANGDANPASKNQMIVEIKNIEVSKSKLDCFNPKK